MDVVAFQGNNMARGARGWGAVSIGEYLVVRCMNVCCNKSGGTTQQEVLWIDGIFI